MFSSPASRQRALEQLRLPDPQRFPKIHQIMRYLALRHPRVMAHTAAVRMEPNLLKRHSAFAASEYAGGDPFNPVRGGEGFSIITIDPQLERESLPFIIDSLARCMCSDKSG